MLTTNRVTLQERKEYLYCTCGQSKTKTFCDGSHVKTNFQPIKFEVRNTDSYPLCRCKKTKNAPYCDASHTKD